MASQTRMHVTIKGVDCSIMTVHIKGEFQGIHLDHDMEMAMDGSYASWKGELVIDGGYASWKRDEPIEVGSDQWDELVQEIDKDPEVARAIAEYNEGAESE
jgi:hypothetical protein